MEQSRAAIFHGPQLPIEVRTLPLSPLRTGEILVRNTYCTLCGSDLHTFRGRRPVATPTILGHEMIGRIVTFGPQSCTVDLMGQSLREGDRITWTIAASCGACFFCENDLPQKCERLFKYGHESLEAITPWSGGLADHCVLQPGTGIVRLPDRIPDAVASPANCATATAAAALRIAARISGQINNDLSGKSLLVLGAGLLGLTISAMASRRGARCIICCDSNPIRAENARRFGASDPLTTVDVPHIRHLTSGRGVDLALDATGSTEAMQRGLESLRIGGGFVWLGAVFPTPALAIDPEQIIRRQITISGSHNYRPLDLVTAVQFLRDHHEAFPFAEMVSVAVALTETTRAFEQAESPMVFRSAVQMGSSS